MANFDPSLTVGKYDFFQNRTTLTAGNFNPQIAPADPRRTLIRIFGHTIVGTVWIANTKSVAAPTFAIGSFIAANTVQEFSFATHGALVTLPFFVWTASFACNLDVTLIRYTAER